MSCKVDIGDDGLEDVVFLYKLAAGACPKSYGVNVARLAGQFSSHCKTFHEFQLCDCTFRA